MPSVAELQFPGSWRRYQEQALAAFEADRARGRHRTHIVAPPGSGKTAMGLEIIRRIGAPALVLVPNQAVQAQWVAAIAGWGGEPLVTTAVEDADDRPIRVLTYQALCRLEDPGAALEAAALRRWAQDRAASSGEDAAVIAEQALAWEGEAARRRDAQIRRRGCAQA